MHPGLSFFKNWTGKNYKNELFVDGVQRNFLILLKNTPKHIKI